MTTNRFLELDGAGAVLQKTPSVIARLEPARGLMWGPTLPEQLAWEAGKTACAEFRLFGFTDWRMPTVEELLLLADRTRFDPAIDTDAFPDTKSAGWIEDGVTAGGEHDRPSRRRAKQIDNKPKRRWWAPGSAKAPRKIT
jgi:hypothetical protein